MVHLATYTATDLKLLHQYVRYIYQWVVPTNTMQLSIQGVGHTDISDYNHYASDNVGGSQFCALAFDQTLQQATNLTVPLLALSGSTAYSVSAGGSMVHPNVPAILLTPVCPHSLSFRPIILPDYAELELRIPANSRCTAWVCFDGRGRQELQRGDSIKVKMSENPVPTINKTDLTGDWFDSLERCFHWSDRMEQKPLSS